MGPAVCKRARGLSLGAFTVPLKFRAHARPPHHQLPFSAPVGRDSGVQQGRNPLHVVSRSNGPQRLAPQAPGVRGRYRLIVALHARSVLRQMALRQMALHQLVVHQLVLHQMVLHQLVARTNQTRSPLTSSNCLKAFAARMAAAFSTGILGRARRCFRCRNASGRHRMQACTSDNTPAIFVSPPTSLDITSNGIICYLLVTDGMLIAVRDVNNPF